MTSQSLKNSTVSVPASRVALRSTGVARLLAEGVMLAIVFGSAVGVRIAYLTALGYNSDEAVYAGQGAAIAQVPILTDLFPIFRAHPLLFQFLLALIYSVKTGDAVGRLASVAIGVATVFVIYRLGVRLYGRRAGLYAALFLALMPYHVIPTRQVLLDGSMMFFATVTLYLLVRFSETERPIWLYAVGASMGLTVLSKETGILLVGAIYGYLALTPEVRVRIVDIIISFALMVLTMLPFPLSISLAGGGGKGTTGNYLVWQLFRRPNHTWDFYPTVVPPAIGLLVIVAAIAGLWLLRRHNGWREKLLVWWILVPVAFFELWPTKGFQYLLPIAAPMVLLAARTLAHWPERSLHWRGRTVPRHAPGAVMALVIAVSLFIPTWQSIQPRASDTFLAGSGGVPGGREAGEWVRENAPEGATFMTIGPSMANIIKYYGHQQAYGISVSPNPLHRNPSYSPIINPDFRIRTGDLQYLVWDSFSAGRTTFFSDKLLYYVQKYNGRVAHTETVTVTTPDGETVEKPVIIIYEVSP